MSSRLFSLLLVACAALTVVAPGAAQADPDSVERWDFNVYLGNKRLGRHTFEVVEVDGQQQVRSEAEFKYKLLFIPAYRYRHSNTERWADNCLLQFEAQTNDNGKRIRASGARSGEGFEVVGENGAEGLPECVMSFAYWNRSFLNEDRLLNPQSGEYLDVEVEVLPEAVLEVRGERIPATPYRLVAEDVELVVWYSPDDKWLALESVAEDGQVLRYELS